MGISDSKTERYRKDISMESLFIRNGGKTKKNFQRSSITPSNIAKPGKVIILLIIKMMTKLVKIIIIIIITKIIVIFER